MFYGRGYIFFLIGVDAVLTSMCITGSVKEPPKNSRAAGLRSDERAKREKNRIVNEVAAFEQEKLLFERERARILEDRDQGGWVSVVSLAEYQVPYHIHT